MLTAITRKRSAFPVPALPLLVETMHKDEHIYEWGKSLIGLDVTMSDMGKATGVQVISHNQITGEDFVGECKLENVKLKIGGRNDWRSVYAGVVRQSIRTVIDPSVIDRTEAEEVAEALMREMSFDFIKGYGKAEGDAGLRAGAVVTIKYAGIRYDGEYIAEEVEHKLSMKGGYTTEFDIRRNMIGDEAVEALGGSRAVGPSHAPSPREKPESEQITVYEEEEETEDGPEFRSLKWKQGGKEIAEALVDDEVILCCEVKNIPDGKTVAFNISEQGENKDNPVDRVEGVVKDGRVEAPWKVVYKGDAGSNCAEEIEKQGWTVPDYRFVVEYAGVESEWGKTLEIKGWIRRQIKDNEAGKNIANRKYTLIKPNETMLEGVTDQNGFIDASVEIAKNNYLFLHEAIENYAGTARNNLWDFMVKLLERNNLGFAKNHKMPMYKLAEWMEKNNICALNDDIEAVLLNDKIVIPKDKNELLKIIAEPIPVLEMGTTHVNVLAKSIVPPLAFITILYAVKFARNIGIARRESSLAYPEDHVTGGWRDAFRHALWLALNMRDFGEHIARAVGDANERLLATPWSFIQADVHMDIHNNEVGIETGRNNLSVTLQRLISLIEDQLQQGTLLVMRRTPEAHRVYFFNELYKSNDRDYTTVIGFDDPFVRRRDAAQRIVDRIIGGIPDTPAEEIRIVDIMEVI